MESRESYGSHVPARSGLVSQRSLSKVKYHPFEMKRLADPYPRPHVIDDARRGSIRRRLGCSPAAAVAAGWWWFLAALGVQLVVGLAFGRRFCLPCLVYFELVQRRFGEGRIEDSRPPKFANKVGAVVLLAAAAAYALDVTVSVWHSEALSPRSRCSQRRPASARAARRSGSAASCSAGRLSRARGPGGRRQSALTKERRSGHDRFGPREATRNAAMLPRASARRPA